jgi:hypothetical protein
MQTNDRQALVEELAVEIASFMRGYGTPAHHSFMSAFTACCSALWRLGVAFPTDAEGLDTRERPISDHEGRLAAYFRILPEAEIRLRVEGLPQIEDEAFEWLLEAFVRKADYLPERFPVHRDWFAPLPADRPLLEAFRRCGFAAFADGNYRWSDTMTPYMATCGYWTESGRDRRELLAEELRAFLSQLPDVARYELIDLARQPGCDLFITKRVIDGFEHENWLRHFPLYGHSPISVARDIRALLRPADWSDS